MSPETSRVPVPTNGKGPHPAPEESEAVEPLEPEGASLAFTPAQLAIGFGIIASLVVVLAGRLRNRRRSGRR